jgi:hypothetical protein
MKVICSAPMHDAHYPPKFPFPGSHRFPVHNGMMRCGNDYSDRFLYFLI